MGTTFHARARTSAPINLLFAFHRRHFICAKELHIDLLFSRLKERRRRKHQPHICRLCRRLPLFSSSPPCSASCRRAAATRAPPPTTPSTNVRCRNHRRAFFICVRRLANLTCVALVVWWCSVGVLRVPGRGHDDRGGERRAVERRRGVREDVQGVLRRRHQRHPQPVQGRQRHRQDRRPLPFARVPGHARPLQGGVQHHRQPRRRQDPHQLRAVRTLSCAPFFKKKCFCFSGIAMNFTVCFFSSRRFLQGVKDQAERTTSTSYYVLEKFLIQ
jgi:hypothetical protein